RSSRRASRPDLRRPDDIDEPPVKREPPRRLAIRLADEKARIAGETPLVKKLGNKTFILAADTVVGLGRRILPKPETADEAEAGLWLLSGRSHWVYSAVTLLAPGGRSWRRCSETRVRFKRLSREDVESYIKAREWRGKAGGYALQGRAESFVRSLSGPHSGVVGLPLYETIHLLQGAGYPVHYTWLTAPLSGV